MSELYVAPATLRNADLNDMAELLRDQRLRALDVVAPAAKISAYRGDLVVADTEVDLGEDGVTPTAGRYRITASADGQVAEMLNVPVRYLRRMRESAIDLYDANVNGWLHGLESGGRHAGEDDYPGRPGDERSFLLRILRAGGDNDEPGTDGIVRAVLSDKFRIIDNLDVLLATLAGVKDAGVHVEVRGADLTETRMYVKLWAPEVAALAPSLLQNYRSPFDGGAVRVGAEGSHWSVESARAAAAREGQGYKPGDEPVLFAGFIFKNSETGHGRYSIEPQIVVQICGNGLTVTAESLRRTHIGGKLDEGEIKWSAQTQQRNLDLIKSQTADAVRSFLDVEFVEKMAAELEAAAGVKVADPDETIKFVAKHFLIGGQRTAGGVMQAVSSAAQAVENADVANDLEARAIPAMQLVAARRES
jgi:hypothetical protein